MSDYQMLTWWDLSWAISLIGLNAVLSLSFRLGLHRSLFVASLRTVVQLSLIGLILNFVFSVGHWAWVAGLIFLMAFVAGVTATSRTRFRYRRMYWDSVFCMFFSVLMFLGFSLLTIFRPVPWYSPQFVIPIAGMILGNMLTGVTLAIENFNQCLFEQSRKIEYRLSLGATAKEAARPAIQQALRMGMTPIINSMMVVGLVSLPGMMTGQILGGVAPGEAVKYQIVIMFLIAASTGMGTAIAVGLSFVRLFSSKHQLLRERLSRVNAG